MKYLIVLAFVTFANALATAQIIPEKFQIRSVSGCGGNKLSMVHITDESVEWLVLNYPDKGCLGEPTVEKTIFNIIDKVSWSDRQWVASKNNSWFNLQIDQIQWGYYRINIREAINKKGDWNVAVPRWYHKGSFWDGESSLISQFLDTPLLVGENCYRSDDWQPDFQSYRIELLIFPTHLSVAKLWFQNPSCEGSKVEERDWGRLSVQSAESNGENEVITLESGDVVEIEKSGEKWTISGSPILAGEYSKREPQQFDSFTSPHKIAPNAWTSTNPLTSPSR